MPTLAAITCEMKPTADILRLEPIYKFGALYLKQFSHLTFRAVNRPRKGAATLPCEVGGYIFDSADGACGYSFYDAGPVYHPGLIDVGGIALARYGYNGWTGYRYASVETYDDGNSLFRHRSQYFSFGKWSFALEWHCNSPTSFFIALTRFGWYRTLHANSGVFNPGDESWEYYWMDRQVHNVDIDGSESDVAAYVARHRVWDTEAFNLGYCSPSAMPDPPGVPAGANPRAVIGGGGGSVAIIDAGDPRLGANDRGLAIGDKLPCRISNSHTYQLSGIAADHWQVAHMCYEWKQLSGDVSPVV